MSKFKYAFLLNSETLTPESYTGTIESDAFIANVYAVNSMEMACETSKKLVDDGVQLIDLCGDFDEEKSEGIKSYVGKPFDIAYAKYTESEMEKLSALGDDIDTYGIIIKVEGTDPNQHFLDLKSEELYTRVVGVSTMGEACEQAKKMTEDGIAFIELCSAFDEKAAEQIIDAINGKVPVGYAG